MKRTLLALATTIHLLPHPFGVSSVGALALYAGAHGGPRTSWLVPWLPLTLGAVVTGVYDPLVMAFVFAAFSLSTLAGRRWLTRQRSFARYGAAIGTGAIIFFLLSNLSVWLAGYYPPTPAGLIECYVNGVPFLIRALAADAAYCGLLFGLHAAAERRDRQPALT